MLDCFFHKLCRDHCRYGYGYNRFDGIAHSLISLPREELKAMLRDWSVFKANFEKAKERLDKQIIEYLTLIKEASIAAGLFL